MNPEVTVLVHENGNISIQGGNILEKKEEAKTVLENAMKALEHEPDEKYKNELVYKPKH